jgi:hypothetical protein
VLLMPPEEGATEYTKSTERHAADLLSGNTKKLLFAVHSV